MWRCISRRWSPVSPATTYTLGTEMRNQSRAVVAAIVKANAAGDKSPHLLVLRERLDERLITVRIAKEARAFKRFESFQYAIEQVVSVCRQNEGWLRATSKKVLT